MSRKEIEEALKEIIKKHAKDVKKIEKIDGEEYIVAEDGSKIKASYVKSVIRRIYEKVRK